MDENIHLRIQRRGDVFRLEGEDGGERCGPETGWTAAEATDFGGGLDTDAKAGEG